MRARVSSHIFLTSFPFLPMILPTYTTGTISRKTLSPGHPGHFGCVCGCNCWCCAPSDSGGSSALSSSGTELIVFVGGEDIAGDIELLMM